MKKHLLLLLAFILGINIMNANPIGEGKAKAIGQKFASAKLNTELQNDDLKLVYTGLSNRNEACFYAYNIGQEGFVIVSADDRFRPIVGYSDEGPFETENMSPELQFYLEKIIEARTSRNAVAIDNIAEEWDYVATSGQLLSRNGGRGVDYICTTKWNQDSPYNFYAPEASGGPGGRCYAGCVATAMSQVMKRWNHPLQGTGSHSYFCSGYGRLEANFGETTYDWENMTDRLGATSTDEEIEAVALLMYHCAVSVDMSFSPNGSGANSWDVPYAIRHYFSYSNQANLRGRDEYSLVNWQNMLKESFDIGWPVYYSGFSNDGGHAFVCDGYDDNDLFHFNWGWGGSSDGWFVIDEIDYAGWAQAIFNYVPSDVYTYMPMQPENLTVETSNDFDYAATLTWNNPTQNIHLETLSSIDQIVVTRNGEIIHTEDNVTPGAAMSFTDHYMPAVVDYSVYAIVHNAKGLETYEEDVVLGPTCQWTVEMTSSDEQGWHGGTLVFVNTAGNEIARLTSEVSYVTKTVHLPMGHVGIYWEAPDEAFDHLNFKINDPEGNRKVRFDGTSNDLDAGLFFILNNTCSDKDDETEGPEQLAAVASGNDVSLTWNDIDGAINYHIFRDHLLIAVTTENSYNDSNVTGNFHSYYVTAFTNEGETMPSNECQLMLESSCETPINLRYEMTSATKVKVSWDAPQDENLTGYMLYRRAPGENFRRIKLLTKTFHTDNLAALPDNRYEYAVTAYYQANDCESGYATTESDPEKYAVMVNKSIIPQNLDFLIHEGHVILQWDEASMAESYNIYRNGELIGHASSNDYVDFNSVAQQPYHYTVTGRTAFVESSPSNPVYVDWTTDVEENVHEGISLYPNPTNGIVTVETSGQQAECLVFNLMGQEVMRQSSNTSKTILNLSSLPEGSYFIQVATAEENKTFKIVKIQ